MALALKTSNIPPFETTNDMGSKSQESLSFFGLSADACFLLCLSLLTALQIASVALTPLNLTPDESHYWEWSRRLDWAYYSKGPLVALLIRISTSIFGDTAFAIRFPSIICSVLFSISFFYFLRRETNSNVALLAWLLLRTSLLFTGIGYAMTTDAPMALFWLLGIVCALDAVRSGKIWLWVVFGVCSGLAVWAKYTAIFLPIGVGVGCLCVEKDRRRKTLYGLVLSLFLLGLFLFPILAWNQKHAWVNFSHNATHVVRESGVKFTFDHLPELFFGQLGLVGPVLFCGILFALWASREALSSRIRENQAKVERTDLLFYWLLCAPLLAICMALSLTKPIYANWPLPAYISGVLMLACMKPEFFYRQHSTTRSYRVGVGLNLLALFVAHLLFFGVTFGMAPQKLASKKMFGWHKLGVQVESILHSRNSSSQPFIVAESYALGSSIAFYTPSHPEVLVANFGGRRMNQYDIWSGWEQKKGQDALIILPDPSAIEQLRGNFQSIQPATTHPFEVVINGKLLRQFYFFWGKQYDGSVPELPEKS